MIEAARLANLNQTEQETWEQLWSEGVPAGHDIGTNPTCSQPKSQGTLLKSAHSLHSLDACDVNAKRALTQWNGYQNCR